MYVCKANFDVLTNFIPSGYAFPFGCKILKLVGFLMKCQNNDNFMHIFTTFYGKGLDCIPKKPFSWNKT